MRQMLTRWKRWKIEATSGNCICI